MEKACIRMALEEVAKQLPGPRGERSKVAFKHGTLGPDDVLFAPAGLPHRFEDFTDDLVVWVMFYGPEGGEAT